MSGRMLTILAVRSKYICAAVLCAFELIELDDDDLRWHAVRPAVTRVCAAVASQSDLIKDHGETSQFLLI